MAEKKFEWNDRWALGFRLWLERSGQAVLGKGRAELLTAIGQTNSISAAARDIGMSYRHAWTMVQEINQAAGFPLVEAAVGGKRGGGARLTLAGEQATRFFQALQSEMAGAATNALRRTLKVTTDVDCLHVVAAVSLQEVVGQVLTEYSLRHPTTHVRTVYGASNELADHLLRGMAADVFLSADRSQLDRLDEAGLVDRKTQQHLAKNGLAAVAATSRTLPIRTPADLLKDEVRHLVLAEPACPLGGYSKAYLERLGIYERLLPRVIHVDNARAVLAALHGGRADVALAFASEAVTNDQCQLLFRAPSDQACVDYYGAALHGAGKRGDAVNLLEFLQGPAGRSCFRRCGFQIGSGRTKSRQSR